jgi:hypothetical protein
MQPRTIINADTPLGGMQYPFFINVPDWELVIDVVSLIEEMEIPPYNPCGRKLMLSWINDGKICRVYARDMNWKQFRAQFDWHTSLQKGALSLSKRMSRVTRPMFAWSFFYTRDLKIKVDPKLNAKLWDGAGLVSRRMLQKMQLHLPKMPSLKKSKVYAQLEHARRVEFTILNGAGQFKGHALVVDDMVEDFILPNDPKKELRMGSGKTFVSFDFPHAKEEMLIDSQSLINHGEFIPLEMYEQWMQRSMDQFLEKLENGEIQKGFEMIETEHWTIPEYFRSGGEKEWLRGPMRSLANQWVTTIKAKGIRVPINGGRVYIMTEEVARAAGWDVHVKPGQVQIDMAQNVALVSNEDWTGWIADVLGGADMDDALWAMPFIDIADGKVKILCWRSPNQWGEYALLEPADIDSVAWAGALPKLDSTKLAPRIDQQHIIYQGLIKDDAPFGKGRTYSMGLMEEAIEALNKNAGVLGAYCNLLMVMTALGLTSKTKPDTLEKLIDASVKTGADLTQFREWVWKTRAYIMKKGWPVPAAIAHRLSRNKPVPLTEDHWIDNLVKMIKEKLAAYNKIINDKLDKTQPPAPLVKYALSHPELAGAAREIRKVYATTLRDAMPDPSDEDFDEAHFQVAVLVDRLEDHDQWPVMAHILVQAIAERKSDAAAWTPATAHLTLRMLREIGIVAFIDGNGNLYMNAAPEPFRPIKVVRVNGTWFEMAKVTNPEYTLMTDIDASERAVWKDRIARRNWSGAVVDIEALGDRLIAKTQLGNMMGFVDRKTEVEPQRWKILAAQADDGNLNLYLEEAEYATA